MTTSRSEDSLSLFNIAAGLLELMQFREEIARDAEMTPDEIKQSLEASDVAIREYVAAEVKKVDSIAAYFREFDARELVCKQEADRWIAKAGVWAQRRERLEATVKGVMENLRITRLEGSNTTLRIKNNPPATEVRQPELTPRKYGHVSVKVNGQLWEDLQAVAMDLRDCPKEVERVLTQLAQCKESDISWQKNEIKKDLKSGAGVPGCTLKESTRLEVE